jgi:hypothetical protein
MITHRVMVDCHLLVPYISWLSVGWLSMPHAGSGQRVAREKCGEAFSGNDAAYKYQVNMQV